MKYAKGIMWLDDCRIPFVDNLDLQKRLDEENSRKSDKIREGFSKTKAIPNLQQQGRFTPSLLVCDDMLNDGVITKQSKRTYKPTEHTGSLFGNSPQADGVGIGDSGSSSRYYDLDKWFDNVIDNL